MANSKSRSESHRSDLRFLFGLRALTIGYGVTLVLFAFTLIWKSQTLWLKDGVSFLSTQAWNPVLNQYGSLAFLWGSATSSFLALLLAAPVGILAALAIKEWLPSSVRGSLQLCIEWLAIVPSVVWGLWGLFVLVPVVRQHFQPALQAWAPEAVLFSGPPLGLGLLAASLLLALMIIPTIVALSSEVFERVPTHQKEAALALGATRFEMIRLAVLQPAWPALLSICILALGRALGETMAVAMVIGNRATLIPSLFSPAATITSTIANEYAEATESMHLEALVGLGVILLVFSTLSFSLSRWGLNRWMKAKR